jgi:hypothetical protein
VQGDVQLVMVEVWASHSGGTPDHVDPPSPCWSSEPWSSSRLIPMNAAVSLRAPDGSERPRGSRVPGDVQLVMAEVWASHSGGTPDHVDPPVTVLELGAVVELPAHAGERRRVPSSPKLRSTPGRSRVPASTRARNSALSSSPARPDERPHCDEPSGGADGLAGTAVPETGHLASSQRARPGADEPVTGEIVCDTAETIPQRVMSQSLRRKPESWSSSGSAAQRTPPCAVERPLQ